MNKVARSAGGDLGEYFRDVSRIPVMSAIEEVQVARLYRETGDAKYADRLVCSNLRFVAKIAMEYRNYGFPVQDLIQEGNLGILRAVKSFDPERGFRLISYGVWWVRAYVQEYILNNWCLVKIGTTQLQRRLFNRLQSSQKRLAGLTGFEGRGTRLQVLADAVGGSVRDVEEMENRVFGRDLSLDAEFHSGDEDSGTSLYDRLLVDGDGVDEHYQNAEERRNRAGELAQALDQLNARDRHIVESRYLRDRCLTLRELGTDLGISKERVRQLESRAIRRLQELIDVGKLNLDLQLAA